MWQRRSRRRFCVWLPCGYCSIENTDHLAMELVARIERTASVPRSFEGLLHSSVFGVPLLRALRAICHGQPAAVANRATINRLQVGASRVPPIDSVG